ncbi:MAG TPA: alcohol dehydrogenase catalytic domain-containing protein [Edaphobacter sp.]|uniref:zinc-dependent alcohol dehydrogenase n=1 Tax=Edaphobacter sp. TaxID=1934404 RepID=UPI002C9135A1|nr:alcohol dehydrogenase catalytic domain-containing protein [Edaphobacter sp.]HUZ93527.1 alcohol dehydrogenase catalytic domain-containing protein [Edaphobacter sp.]
MKMMLAARYLGPGQLEAEEIPLPVISDEEALIQVDACGFCGSDLSIVAGTHPRAKAPLTVGHELSGRIVQIRSSSTSLVPGDRVTTYPLISCGTCHACTHGNPHVCRQLRLFGFDVDGGMAEFVKLPVSSLMKLPEEMPGHIGALIEPLAVSVHGIARTNLEGVQVAAVLGGGPIGLLTALVAQARGVPHVVVSDILPSRLELATSLGLHAVAAGADLKKLVMELSDGNGADVIFECAGSPSSAREMTSLVRSRGVIVNLGVFKKPVEIDMQAVNFKEIEVLGSRVYERRDFQTAIELAMQLPLEKIVTHSFPLRDVATAFKQFKMGEVCKVLILPTEYVS